jgi:hypothetical protein
MKRHMLRGVITAILAAVVALPVGAQPAAAADGGIDSFVKDAIDIVKSFFGGGMSNEEVVELITRKIDEAKAEIIANQQRLAVAGVRECAATAVEQFQHFNSFTDTRKQQFAGEVSGCINRIESLRPDITDPAALSVLGFASQVLAPIALSVNRAVGFSTGFLVAQLIATNQALLPALAPACTEYWDYDFPEQQFFPYVIYSCTGVDGATVFAKQYVQYHGGPPTTALLYLNPATNAFEEVTREWVRNAAGRDTAWAVARDIVPQLQSL